MTVTAVGAEPAENAEPETGVSIPVARFTEYPDTLFPELFATYKKLPEGSKLNEKGVDTPANGELGNCLSFPVFGFRL